MTQTPSPEQPVSASPREPISGPSLAVIFGLLGVGSVILISMMIFTLRFVDGVPTFFALLLSGSAVVVFFLAIRVISRLGEVWRRRRIGLAGSRMHLRLIGLLSIVAIFPTMIAFVFSAVILQQVSQDYFVERIEAANDASRNVANKYFDSVSNTMGWDLSRVAFDLNVLEQRGEGVEGSPIGFRQYLYGQAVLRNWAALYLLDGDRNIISRVVVVPDGDYRLPEPEIFRQLDNGEDESTLFHFSAQDPRAIDLYYGVIKVQLYGGGYLIAYKGENPVMTQALRSVRTIRDDNAAFKQRLDTLSLLFLFGYGLLGLIILLSAVWAGLQVANAIVAPVGRLVSAAEEISAGNLTARVAVRPQDGELGDLAQAFNEMTRQLESQRNDLIAANMQSDERRQFTETVISGVSAGVIGVDPEGRITITNKRAAEITGLLSGRMLGEQVSQILPEFGTLIEAARIAEDHTASGQVELARNSMTRVLNIRIGGLATGDQMTFVVTFDDITELISAQRNAAWGDVARRIAHEIKNPLTPIQLSAERLRRKYRGEITSDPEVFERCTDTIIRHVGDIGRMVNEFSSFARMPEPVMAAEDAGEIMRGAAFPFQVAHPEIEFSYDLPDEPVMIHGDGRLLLQACTNLIKNACESIEEQRSGATPSLVGQIRLELEATGEAVEMRVLDNGTGLPASVSHRLTEPYMTTRERGTGLGLAIVRKVIDEHGGRLTIENSDAIGPTGALAVIRLPLNTASDQAVALDKNSKREHA